MFLQYQFRLLGIPKSKLRSAAKQFVKLKDLYKRRIHLQKVMQNICPMHWKRKHIQNFSMDSRCMASRVQILKWNRQRKIESTVWFDVAEESASLLIDQIGKGNFFILSMSKSRLEMWRQEVIKWVSSFQFFLFWLEIIFDTSRFQEKCSIYLNEKHRRKEKWRKKFQNGFEMCGIPWRKEKAR